MVSLAPIILICLYDLRPSILIGSANKAVKKLCVAVIAREKSRITVSHFCIAGMIFRSLRLIASNLTSHRSPQ